MAEMAVTSFSRSVEKAVEKSLSNAPDDIIIRSKQLECVINICNGYDTLCLLPTGFGKSLIYQVLPSVFKELNKASNPIVIVISPLVSLMNNQVTKANEKKYLCLSSCRLENSSFQDIESGNFNLIFGSPESWVDNKRWRNLLSSKLFTDNLVCIVVDEVHKVKWGQASFTYEKPFREAFSRIKDLRSLCKEHVPVLAATATADIDMSELIIASCGLSRKVKVVSSCVDRKNIRLSVVNISNKDINCLSWIVEGLKEYGVDAPKIIIYCKSVKLAGWLYEQLLVRLGEFAYLKKDFNRSESLLGMYHSQTLENHKDKVLNSLVNNDMIRLFIATSSLGCGIDATDVMFVVHYGPSYALADYCQQIGRAGRNTSSLCHAVMYVYPIRKSLLSDDMKSYIDKSKSSCLRTNLFTPFNENGVIVQPLDVAHFCCSYCSKRCKCDIGHCKQAYNHDASNSHVDESVMPPLQCYREVSPDEKDLVKSMLTEFMSSQLLPSDTLLFVPASYVCGLTDSVISVILENLSCIKTAEDVKIFTNIVDRKVVKEVLLITNEVFDDMQIQEQGDDVVTDFNLSLCEINLNNGFFSDFEEDFDSDV